MAKGRKKTPDQMKLVRGTFRKDRANDCAPDQAPDGMRAPSWLPAGAVEYFGVLKTRLEVHGLNSSSFTEALAMAALRLHEIDELSREIEAHGRVYETTNAKGDVVHKSRPEVAQRNDALRHLQGLLAEFGLTPASISKCSAPGKAEKKTGFAKLG
jgi:phage terminase small subunit